MAALWDKLSPISGRGNSGIFNRLLPKKQDEGKVVVIYRNSVGAKKKICPMCECENDSSAQTCRVCRQYLG